MRHLVAPMLVLLTSCRGSDTGLFEVSATARSGVAGDEMPGDLPSDAERMDVPEGARVIVRLRELRVSLTGPHPRARVVPLGDRELDLRSPALDPIPLGAATLPRGRITTLELVLADEARYQVGEESRSVRCSGCGEGIELSLGHQVVLGQAESLSVTLVFDRDRALYTTAEGTLMVPAVRADVSAPFRFSDPRFETE